MNEPENTKPQTKKRLYRVVATNGLFNYKCQYRWLGIWWTFKWTDYEDRAKDFCRIHADRVVWQGWLP